MENYFIIKKRYINRLLRRVNNLDLELKLIQIGGVFEPKNIDAFTKTSLDKSNAETRDLIKGKLDDLKTKINILKDQLAAAVADAAATDAKTTAVAAKTAAVAAAAAANVVDELSVAKEEIKILSNSITELYKIIEEAAAAADDP